MNRVVMLGPPNSGAWLAGHLHSKLGQGYPLIYGDSGLQLRRGDLGLAERAGSFPPNTELGVVAGGSGTAKGLRNLANIPGDNDGIVTVEETILPGMRDFTLVHYDHTRMLFSKQVAQLTDHFLKHGSFKKRRKPHLPED